MLLSLCKLLSHNGNAMRSSPLPYECLKTQLLLFHTNLVHNKEADRRNLIESTPKRDEGVTGERSFDIDATGYSSLCEFPDVDTPNRIFEDMRFADIPIVYIKVTKNNTIMSLTNAKGDIKARNSCGTEGFKNCRKGTNIAAQATAISMSRKIINSGVRTVRVMIKGLGPGRMSSLKGLQMGGINIISITDATPICAAPHARPPAARSL